MGAPKPTEELGMEIGRLPDLSHSQLKERWRTLFGNLAPAHISRRLLVEAIAYRMREKATGGLSPEVKRRLREIAAAIRDGREDVVLAAPRMRPGVRLFRAWDGTTHIVEVLGDGFEWQGRRYGSLSAIAKAITGTNWNGYVFFGVKRRPAHNKNAAGRRHKPAQSEGAALRYRDAEEQRGGGGAGL
jgi:hypothetical protein